MISGGLDGQPPAWDVKQRESISVFDGYHGEEGGRNYSVAINRDASVAVSGFRNNSIRAWHPETGTETAEIDVGDAVNSLAFTPTGKTLMAGQPPP